MSRRRSVPWIHRYSRFIMGAIAVVGILITAYLTIMSFTGGTVACPVDQTGVSGCDRVLSSEYGKLFGTIPLSLLGLLAYIAMGAFALTPYLVSAENNKTLRNKIEDFTWQMLLIGGTAMVVFSGYLIYISLFIIGGECLYCLSSAACSLALFVLAIIGREWEELGQLFFTCVIVAMVTLVGALGLFAGSKPAATVDGKVVIPAITSNPQPPLGWEISTTSTDAEISLAEHLTKIGAKMYGAFWCPHCFEQKELFGKQAFAKIDYVECAPEGKNPRPELCEKAGIQGFPSWEINGQIYPGTQSLEKLAQLSGYQGSTKFKYTLSR